MRKALVLTVLYLFGSEAVAQKSFRHAPTVALDDVQDSEMFIGNGGRIGSTIYNPGNPLGQGPLINRPLPPIRNTFDDVEDNEMALNLNIQGAARDAIRLANNDYRVKVGRWDDAQDDEMFRFDRPPVGSTPPFNPSPKFGFDDSQDSEMFINGGRIGSTIYNPGNPLGQGPLINRPIPPRTTFDDVEDNEMALNLNSQGAVRDAIRLANNDYRVKVGRWDAEDDELFTQGDLGRMSSPFLSGSGLVGGGGSARGGGVAMGGTGQLNLNVGRNTQLIGGLSASHAPGSRVNFAPHVGVNFKFDDENDDQLFAEDDELFNLDRRPAGSPPPFFPSTKGRFDDAQDDEMFGVPLGNGGSGIYASGGSARGGGVAWGGVGQYSHNIGKNTALIGGATVSHYPGSKVNIAPHVGVKFSFDDEN